MRQSPARLHAAIFLIAGVLLGSCDSSSNPADPSEIVFDGLTYALLGQAEFELSGAGLVVRNIGSSGNDGVRVTPDGGFEAADIRALPVDLPANGRWGMQVFGETSGGSTALATVWNDALSAEEHEIIFDFAPGMNVSTLIAEYYLDGRLQHSVELPVNGAGNRSSRRATAGRGTGRPTSVHVICVNGELIVATDYNDGGAPRTGSGGCAAELLTQVPGAEFPVCVDFVRARPVSQTAFPPPTSFEVTGRSISQFVVTSGSVENP